MRVVMPKGTKIICPDCDLHIATANKDIVEGIMNPNELDSEIGPLYGKPMTCPRCTACYGRVCQATRAGQMYTEQGWMK